MKVVYDERMVADAQSFSPSARKPGEVMASWRRRFPVLEVVAPVPVTIEQLCLAHDPGYVRAVLALRQREIHLIDLPTGSMPFVNDAHAIDVSA